MPEPRVLPPRAVGNGLQPEPVVETDALTYCCGRCGAVVGNAELHAVWHVTVGHALDDVEALVVDRHQGAEVVPAEVGVLDDRPGFGR